MRVSYILLGVVVAAVIVAAAYWLLVQGSQQPRPYSSFTFAGITYPFTYVATDSAEWQAGLMNKTVNSSTFELFEFPSIAVYPFWMKNTYSPLDMIWVRNSTVVYLAHATPCVWYSPNQTACEIYNTNTLANYVIEAQAGFVNETGMMAGDTINIS